MKKPVIAVALLTLVAALLAMGVSAPAVMAAPVHHPAAQATASSEVLSPKALGNLTYKSQLTSSGEVTLTDGKYEDAATKITAVLVNEPMAFGKLDGQDAAAVLLGENGGGSGVFVTLEAVVDQGGKAVNAGAALLGDRIVPLTLAIADNQIVVEMVAQGPGEPMCCPTQILKQVYALKDGALVQVSSAVEGNIPQAVVDKAANGYNVEIIPAVPFDKGAAGGPTGAPLHAVVAFGDDKAATAMQEGKPYLAIYPAAAYARLWSDGGSPAVADGIAALQGLLAAKTETVTAPLPAFPPSTAVNDLVVQPKYLAGNGFQGLRFIGRYGAEKTPVVADELAYHFLGLTDDGQYVVSGRWPISTTVLPAAGAVPEDVTKAATNDFAQYVAGVANQLNGLADDQWSTAPASIDALIESTSINRSPLLTQERLGNLTYKTTAVGDGSVKLTDGKYENAATKDSVVLVSEPRAYGKINGQDAAAVLLGENAGGGSGDFVDLAIVVDNLGEPTNVATTLLGDRVAVSHLAITEDGQIIVDMVAQGPNDPMCCPTMPTTQIYALVGSNLVLIGGVEGTIDGKTIDEQVNAAIIQPTAFDNSMPPGPQGQPKHAVWSWGSFEASKVMDTGGPYVAVYSVPAYEAIWKAAGDKTVSTSIDQLKALLKEQPAAPKPPLPILPVQPATNDIAAQVKYLTLADGGSGIRWVGRLTQDASPLMDWQLRYFFQGLTKDGQRLIVAMIPVTTTVLPSTPEAVSKAEMDQATTDFAAYEQAITAKLNGMAESDFTKNLSALDKLVESVQVTATANPLAPSVLANMTYSSTVTDAKTATLSNGSYAEAGPAGTPLQNTVTLVPDLTAYGLLNDKLSAAVILGESSGGSGDFISLHVVQMVGATPTDIASAALGDRVVVKTNTIQNNQIVVSMIAQGPNDPMCCPTMPVTQTYALTGTQLELVNETKGTPAEPTAAETTAVTETTGVSATTAVSESAPAGADPLVGTAWSWQNTLMSDGAETKPATAGAFELSFAADGQAASTTDCNTYTGSYAVSAGNQIKIDLPAATRKACAPEAQQDAYIKHLTSVQSYMLQDGNLILMLPFDSGTMTFAPVKK